MNQIPEHIISEHQVYEIELNTLKNNASRGFIALLHEILKMDVLLNFEDFFAITEALQRRNNVRFHTNRKKIFYHHIQKDQVHYCNDWQGFKDLCSNCMIFHKIKY